MGPNAISALTLIDPLIKEAYNRTATFNEDPQFRYHWMLCRYGMEAEEGGEAKFGDLIKTVGATSLLDKGRSSCHRAKFLDELIGIRPRDIAEFNKTMVHIDENEDGVLTSFADGTTAHASAVVCCDGIKSVARSLVLGSDHPAVKPVFSGQYAYRGLFPRYQAEEIFGTELVRNGSVFCGTNGYAVVYPVEQGRLINMVADCHSSAQTWPHKEWIHPTTRDQMLQDFQGWGEPIRKMLQQTSDMNQWAMFDSPDAPTYCKGRMCLMGDAAHASTPHQGAGAGMAFEDAYVLSSLLGTVEDVDDLPDAFKTYDQLRRPRTQRLVKTSREAGQMYELCLEGVGSDLSRVADELDEWHEWIWKVDLPGDVERGKRMLKSMRKTRNHGSISSVIA